MDGEIKKGKEVMSDEQRLGDITKLPTDVLIDILSRLPLKLLSSCRWVCKSWFDLIYNPYLADMHYTRSIANNTSPCLLLHDRWKEFFVIDHQVFDNLETSASLFNVKFLDRITEKFKIVDSVNGLICFAPNYMSTSAPLPYYICNPITGEHLSLPISPKHRKRPNFSGFGFDSFTNEYKVIRIMQNHKTMDAEAEIFTIGSGTWRVIPSVPYITDKMQSNVLVKGSLHWISNDVNTLAILSFGIATEKFHVIQLPAFINDVESHGKKNHLAVLGECLAFVVADSVSLSKKKEIWVMKEYGVQKSWVKECIVRQELMVSAWAGGYALTRLRNGDFLFPYLGKALGYYDPQSEIFKLLVIQNKLWEGYYEQAWMHMGSLVSPNNIGQLKKRDS